MTVDEAFAFNPMDASKAKNFAFIAKIRAERPVCRPAEGLVFLADYEDNDKAFRDAKTFSSVGDMRAPGVTVPDEERFLGEIDAPQHPRIRKILLRGFKPRHAQAAEPWTRALVDRKLDEFIAAGRADLMKLLAYPLPGSVAAHALGIPEDMQAQVMDWCNELLHSTWPTTGKTERGVGIAGAFPEMAAYLDEQIRQRHEAGPGGDDLLSIMVHSAEDGWQLPDQHIRTLMVNILAGSLSASFMVGNLLHRYVTDVDGFARVLEKDRSKIPAAVEESLRLEPPVLFMFRHATAETEIKGCPVHAGDQLMLSIASANRDTAAFPNPDDYRLDRTSTSPNLSFGMGPHLCLGNHLTRMVGRVVLEEMLDRFPPGTLALDPNFEWVCVDHMLEYGPERLDLVVSGSGG